MPLVKRSLTSVTSPMTGETVHFDIPKSNISLQSVVTGDPTGFELLLDISLDGINFVQRASVGQNAVVSSIGLPVTAARARLNQLSGTCCGAKIQSHSITRTPASAAMAASSATKPVPVINSAAGRT